MENVWIKRANNYIIAEVSQQTDLLPVGVYKFQVDPMENCYLSQVSDKFEFPYKIYGVEHKFIERVKKSYANTTGNFGILLNGVKGTGKTVTAELICNELNLPVIIIPFHHKNLLSFLNDIQQDVIIFIDEYEKLYDGYNNSLLPIMDGVLNTSNRLVFLLTTNDLRVDRNILQRPSRVRYVKTFEDMTLEVIMEVVSDLLVHKHLFDCTVKMISELPLITMDLVKSIITEVNIHEEDPEAFKDIFNIHSEKSDLYNVYKLQDGKKILKNTYCQISPSYMHQATSVGDEFRINHRYVGSIKNVMSENQIIVEETEYDDNDNEKDVLITYYLEKASKVHKAFTNVVVGDLTI